jgi:hypothetical protein
VDFVRRKVWGEDLIPVVAKPEPAHFDVTVRQPGRLALVAKPERKLANFWRYARDDLKNAYGSVCAYTCVYIPGLASVDHFLPKSRYPLLAYEWNNFRLACSEVNNYKGESCEVIDPFLVRENWFVLDFPSCLVRPSPHVEPLVADQILKTIEVLKLNAADHFVQDRCNIALDFVDGHLTSAFLEHRYPFLAREIRRQGGKETLREFFKRRSD